MTKQMTIVVIGSLKVNDISNLVGQFVSSPRERKKRDRRASRGQKRERKEEKVNDSVETEKLTCPLSIACCRYTARLAQVSSD